MLEVIHWNSFRACVITWVFWLIQCLDDDSALPRGREGPSDIQKQLLQLRIAIIFLTVVIPTESPPIRDYRKKILGATLRDQALQGMEPKQKLTPIQDPYKQSFTTATTALTQMNGNPEGPKPIRNRSLLLTSQDKELPGFATVGSLGSVL